MKIWILVIIAILLLGVVIYPFVKPQRLESDINNSNITLEENTQVSVKTYYLSEIENHSSKSDCWAVVDNKVYNLTEFIPNHPGGDAILKICGKDGTSVFNNKHADNQKANQELLRHYIGNLG